jgi:group I intron endonuclease
MSSTSGVYKITYKKDNRIYIGSSSNIEDRWKWHIQSQIQLIGKMIKKYGRESFTFEIIETVDPIKEKLIEREQFYLDTLQPFPWVNNRGFNLAPKAYTPLGIERSEETKKKMRDSWHKSRGNELYRQQASDRIKGDKNPAKRSEVAAKISKSMTGKTWADNPIRVEKHRQARIGKTRSEETREKMRIAQQKNKTRSDAAKEKFYLLQRTLYEITTPEGSTFQIYSRELKEYCKNNKLQYSNLITTAKTGRLYKKGWRATLIKS